jgi:DNA-binding transcriptional MerR regulator
MAGRVKKRLYYKIGEACKMVGIQPYVLRYWETEFPALNPGKSKSGQRVYGERELELIRRIQQLLYEEGYTIAGAKKKLDAELGADAESADGPPEAAAEAEVLAGEDGAGAAGDAAGERAARLERGVRAALAEAREILSLLD